MVGRTGKARDRVAWADALSTGFSMGTSTHLSTSRSTGTSCTITWSRIHLIRAKTQSSVAMGSGPTLCDFTTIGSLLVGVGARRSRAGESRNGGLVCSEVVRDT